MIKYVNLIGSNCLVDAMHRARCGGVDPPS